MRRIAFLKKAPTPALSAAFQRVEALDSAYATAVQHIIGHGSPLSWELLVRPVDNAREKTVQLASAWADGRASEGAVLEAADALARLMETVIGKAA